MKFYSVRNIEQILSEGFIEFTGNIEPHNRAHIKRYTAHLLDMFKEDDERYYEQMIKYRGKRKGNYGKPQ